MFGFQSSVRKMEGEKLDFQQENSEKWPRESAEGTKRAGTKKGLTTYERELQIPNPM